MWRFADKLQQQGDDKLAALGKQLAALPPAAATRHAAALDRIGADADAAGHHLSRPAGARPVVALLGGTGTGKSTLMNRLVGRDVSATSFRRTFTEAPVAALHADDTLPATFMGLPLAEAADLPLRGVADRLLFVRNPHPHNLLDTPDLDGDRPEHHARADRAFRWVDAVVFVVTPEKYQMTELLPYYRLAARYALPTAFVMNKAQDEAAVEDFAAIAARETRLAEPPVFAVPRDDAAWHPPAETDLPALLAYLNELALPDEPDRRRGVAARLLDLAGRLQDQLVAPLAAERRRVDEALKQLRALQTPEIGLDVSPMTHHLRRRLQQNSVLYLIGPARMLDRVKQMPGTLARLPRTAWRYMRDKPPESNEDTPPPPPTEPPDFRQELLDSFRVSQARIAEAVETALPGLEPTWRFDENEAGNIADEELQALRKWLEERWNATPRDTAVLQKLLSVLPGGKKLTAASEAAPYLLTVYCAVSGTFFGGVDMLVLGGYSLTTWLAERVSNEVAGRTKQASRNIDRRFAELMNRQVDAAVAALQQQVPPAAALATLGKTADALAGLGQAAADEPEGT